MIRNVQSTTAVATATCQPSEYKIGNTTYIVELHFNLVGKETLDEIIERLVHNELENAA